MLSGRTLWVGGASEGLVDDFPMANFNCAFEVIDDFESFRDLFYLLMIGCGVGFRVLESDVAKLPKVKTTVQLEHAEYVQAKKSERKITQVYI